MKKLILIFCLLLSGVAYTQTVYRNNSYGFSEPAVKYVENYYGGYDIKEKNEYGLWVKVGELKKNYKGGWDILEYNQYGILVKTGEIDDE